MSKHEIKIIEQADRGLMYAEGCFETFRVVHGKVFALSAHIQRMQTGLQLLGIEIVDTELNRIFADCIHQAAQRAEDQLLRLTITGGDAPWGLFRKSDIGFNVYLQMQAPIAPSALTLQTVNYPFPLREKQAKLIGDYGEQLQAWQLWKHQLPDQAMPLICGQGQCLSTMTANIAVFDGMHWLTPPLQAGVLPGTLRGHLVSHRILMEQSVKQNQLDNMQAMVCLNAGAWMVPVRQLNGRVLNAEHDAIQMLHQAVAGLDGVPEQGACA